MGEYVEKKTRKETEKSQLGISNYRCCTNNVNTTEMITVEYGRVLYTN